MNPTNWTIILAAFIASTVTLATIVLLWLSALRSIRALFDTLIEGARQQAIRLSGLTPPPAMRPMPAPPSPPLGTTDPPHACAFCTHAQEFNITAGAVRCRLDHDQRDAADVCDRFELAHCMSEPLPGVSEEPPPDA